MPRRDPDRREEILTVEKPEVKEPGRYRVLLHNDDYTPMDFVTQILVAVFHKSPEEAVHIMLAVHRKGIGVAGLYTREVAESKVRDVTELARAHEHPLRCSMEPE